MDTISFTDPQQIDHFTVVCLVAWPLNDSEAGVDLIWTETSNCVYYANCYKLGREQHH